MSEFELVVAKTEGLQSGRVLVSMCILAERLRMREITRVQYTIGDVRKVIERSAGTQFVADVEIVDAGDVVVESELCLANGDRWQCQAAIDYSPLTQAFAPVRDGLQEKTCAKKIDEVGSKVNLLSVRIAGIHDNVSELRCEIITQFEATRQALISPFLNRIPDEQLQYVRNAIHEGSQGDIPEDRAKDIVNLAREALRSLQADASSTSGATPSEIRTLSDAIADPNAKFGHKLELSIPIIPFFLKYKGEANLTSGVNIAELWQWLKSRCDRRGCV